MPYFAQEPLSYLTLPTIKNAYKSFSIKINFRPDNVDGEFTSVPLALVLSLKFAQCWSCWVCTVCLILSRLSSLPSLPHLLLAPSWWEGLILYAGESPSLRATGTQV